MLSTPGQQELPATFVLQVFDLRNKLIAISVPLAEVTALLLVVQVYLTVVQVHFIEAHSPSLAASVYYTVGVYIIVASVQVLEAEEPSC